MPINLLAALAGVLPVAAGSAHKHLSVPVVLIAIAVVALVIALSLLYQRRRQST